MGFKEYLPQSIKGSNSLDQLHVYFKEIYTTAKSIHNQVKQPHSNGGLPKINFTSQEQLDRVNNHLDTHCNTMRLLSEDPTCKHRIRLLSDTNMKFFLDLVPENVRYGKYQKGGLVDVADSKQEKYIQ